MRTHNTIIAVLNHESALMQLDVEERPHFLDKESVPATFYYQVSLMTAKSYHQKEESFRGFYEKRKQTGIKFFRRLWANFPLLRAYFSELFVELEFSDDFIKGVEAETDA